jgi:transposase
MDLAQEQWRLVAPLIPGTKWCPGSRGRPPCDFRAVLNGILWVLRTGAPWKDLPERYPSYQTCHRRFQQWQRAGAFERVLRALAEDLEKRGRIDLTESFIDGTFSGAKRGATRSARRSGAREARSWRSQTAMVFLSPHAWPVRHPTR